MLDVLRKGAQSWGIKVIFGIIIAVFVLAFGMDKSQKGAGHVVATVNGDPISLKQFQETLQRNMETARRQNPGLTPEFLAQIRFKEQVLNQMITQELILHKAAELGISVSKEELAREIHLVPAFQNEKQVFDPQQYTTVLQANNLTPGQFESDFMRRLIMEKIERYISLPAQLTEAQAREYYTFGQSTATLSYISYPWKHYADQVSVTNEEIQAYYESHKAQYALPAQARIAYLLITPATLAVPGTVSDAAISAYYDARKENFKIEEQVKARHILIRLANDASETEENAAKEKLAAAQASLAKGMTFEDVANAYTEDPSGAGTGGELGWFGKGRMVPEFEDVAFATPAGQISEPVRTVFGFHLIKVEETKAPGYQSLDDVKDVIRQTIAEDSAADSLQDHLDQALEVILTGADLAQAAKSLNLPEVSQSSFFTRTAGPQELPALTPEQRGSLFDLAVNATVQNPVTYADGYLLATKTEEKPESITPLAEVHDTIRATLLEEGALVLAKKAADTDLNALNSTGTLANGQHAAVVTTEPFSRQDNIPDLGMNPALTNALFSSAPDTWLPVSYNVVDGYVLARLASITPPADENWDKDKELWMTSLNQRAGQELFEAFLGELRAKAQIQIVNPQALEN